VIDSELPLVEVAKPAHCLPKTAKSPAEVMTVGTGVVDGARPVEGSFDRSARKGS
jgi:hypothetical protein